MEPNDLPMWISDPHYVVDTAAALVLAAVILWGGLAICRFLGRIWHKIRK